ncbi:MAG: hypothetical protein DRJ10_10185 [Bacteroidetes bacterium]|nr:MAG: hypothetical protein DRJ10_10185 [Bacteroidota bacterium]
MADTNKQFNQIIDLCREIFVAKMKDYGTAWRILRPSSLTDQIFIKAQRIRSIETKKEMKVDEGKKSEFIGIINYAIMAIIQLEIGHKDEIDMQEKSVLDYYDKFAEEALELMKRKNHDYDEAWRSMRISSFTDLILMKLYRTKQIEDNKGKTLISEGIDANYYDMINYAVFALIMLEFE